jgi:hypothetical protein
MNKKHAYLFLPLLIFVFSSSTRSTVWADMLTPTPTETTEKVDLPPVFLAETQGDVYVIHDGDKEKAEPPQTLESNDRILTGKDGKAFMEFQSGGTIEIDPGSDMKINQMDISSQTFKARFLLAFGKMKNIIHKLSESQSTFEIEAGGVVSGIRGTTFQVEYDKDKKQEATKTYEGTVYTKVKGKEQLVEKGFAMSVVGGGSPVMAALTGSDIGDFLIFIDSSTDLEKRKEIILKQLEKKLLEKALQKKQNKGPTGFQFGF